ncbi:Dehydrogenase [Sandaracinus amylolyticus]|uniref:Dehydrogenase n=2 Tax=Sandaracinus amylolyticus TaxID=927083 RepID=A0A0F6SDC3_9BACT|nr:Dehydrogenase [Sandaracinus amylolyticus]
MGLLARDANDDARSAGLQRAYHRGASRTLRSRRPGRGSSSRPPATSVALAHIRAGRWARSLLEGALEERRTNMGFRTQRALEEQVVVITGASSGIGLSTARLAAARGAAVVMAARSPEIEQLAEQLRSEGGRAEAVVADVSSEEDVRHVADVAEARFGRIDTWINNAGTSVYGRSLEVPVDDMRELFDTDFWGTVYGSRVAVERMRDLGGTLINVGGVMSERALPLQGASSAAKHAVKGFTDALRVELEHDEVPVQITLVNPASTDTPLFAHAKNRLDDGVPAAPPPVYAPEVAARALLECATRPKREITVGAAGRARQLLSRWMPAVADELAARRMFEPQVRREPHEPRVLGAGSERGDHRGMVRRRGERPAIRVPTMPAVVAGVGAVLVAVGLMRVASQIAASRAV